MPLFNYSHQFELGQTICVGAGKRNRKLGFQPDSAGGHLACLLALQAGSLPAGTGWEAYLPAPEFNASTRSERLDD